MDQSPINVGWMESTSARRAQKGAFRFATQQFFCRYGRQRPTWLLQRARRQRERRWTPLVGRPLEMCAGQNLQERERKETRSRLKKIFLVPVFFRFFSFLERVFPLFPIFLGISHPVLRRFFPVFSSFHLSKPVLGFLMGLKLAILERV